MEHPKRVHVTPVGTSAEEIVEPAIRMGADVVYLLVDSSAESLPVSEIVSGLESDRITVRRIPVDHGVVYDVAALVTTLEERHARDAIRINLSTGRRTAAIGAAMGMMDSDTEATAYTVVESDDRSVQRMNTIDEPGEMGFVDASIDAPTRQELVALAIVFARNAAKPAAIVKRRTLITHLLRTNERFGEPVQFVHEFLRDAATGGTGRKTPREDGFDALNADEKKRIYGLLNTHVADNLEARGYLTVEPHGQSDAMELTQAGRQALKIYRHEVADVVDTLAEEFRTDRWPTWFRSGLVTGDNDDGSRSRI